LRSLPATIPDFSASLGGLHPNTVRMYEGILHDYVCWTETRPGIEIGQLTEATVRSYMQYLNENQYAVRTQAKVLTILSRYSNWAVSENLLSRNPVNHIERPVIVQGAPRELDETQRDMLKNVIEAQCTLREQVIFALGYWAGLRVSEVANLRVDDCSLNQRLGTLVLRNAKGGKTRTIDLHNQARRLLYEYLYEGAGEKDAHDNDSRYVFTSQRAAWLRHQGKTDNLSVRGINHVWKKMKARATVQQYAFIADITFHDLRHDFAHRARQSGWHLEEIAIYLGHQTKSGMPAIATTARYTQPSRKQIRTRLQTLKG
jgi:site-specific recombinase XerD